MEPDAVCGSGGSSVWRYMAALPHLSLIECKLNLVLSLGGKTETEGGGDGEEEEEETDDNLFGSNICKRKSHPESV